MSSCRIKWGDVDEDEDAAGDGDVDGASENWMEI